MSVQVPEAEQVVSFPVPRGSPNGPPLSVVPRKRGSGAGASLDPDKVRHARPPRVRGPGFLETLCRADNRDGAEPAMAGRWLTRERYFSAAACYFLRR